MPIPTYCPKCSVTLEEREDGGRDRPACPDRTCGYVYYGEFSIGCAGVVLRGDKALLVQRGWQPFAGSWQLPGGYAEHDEPLALAVEREVLEEAGITATVRDVIAFRHSVGGSSGGPSTNVYMIFRLDSDSGEPTFDGDEIRNAGFFTLDEMAQMEAVQGLSKWAIEKAIRLGDEEHGLKPDFDSPMGNRPGWGIFGR